MINTTALLQVLSVTPPGASASAGGAAAGSAQASGTDFAQQLQRLTQANAVSQQQATPTPSEPSPPPPREPNATKAPSADGEAGSPADTDETAPERTDAAEETATNAAPRKSPAPRRARSEATDKPKDGPSPAAGAAAEAAQPGEDTEPVTGQVKTRKAGATPADDITDTQPPGLVTASALPQLRSTGRAEAGDPAEPSQIDRPVGGAGQAADALQVTAQAAVVRRALLEASEPSGNAGGQAAAIVEATDGATPVPEGLAPVLAPMTLLNAPVALPGLPTDSRTVTSPWPDSGSATAPTAQHTEDVDGTVGSSMFSQSLGARISVLARDGIEQARLNVHPADMGPIAVRLALEGNQVRVDMSAELGSTRQALEQSLPALATALQDAGFTLAGGGVFQQARDDAPPQHGDSAKPSARERTAAIEARDLPGLSASRPAQPRGIVDLFA